MTITEINNKKSYQSWKTCKENKTENWKKKKKKKKKGNTADEIQNWFF